MNGMVQHGGGPATGYFNLATLSVQARLQWAARNGDTLTLPSREFDAALAHMRLVTAALALIAEISDKGMCLCAPGSRFDLRWRCIGSAVGNVVGYRPVQQRDVLRDYADLAAQRILRSVCDVLPVDQDATVFGVAEAHSFEAYLATRCCKCDGVRYIENGNNVYVVDGSYMPYPGGVNPTLTIQANALRIARQIARDATGHTSASRALQPFPN